MSEQLYRVNLIDGTTIDGLAFEEVTEYLYARIGDPVQAWLITEYPSPEVSND